MPRAWAWCSRHPRWGRCPDPSRPSSRRTARRSAGRTGMLGARRSRRTNVMASLSNSGLAHPPRSNPPLRFSSGPPFPCTTPSTETCVVVVRFMIAVPFCLRGPSWAATHPCYEHLSPDPTPPPGFFRGLSARATRGCLSPASSSTGSPRISRIAVDCSWRRPARHASRDLPILFARSRVAETEPTSGSHWPAQCQVS